MLSSLARSVACLALLVMLPNSALSNASGSDPARGKVLVEGRCAACHDVGSSSTGSPRTDAPNFAAIANIPDQSADKLVWSLVFPPHPEMPDVSFSNNELRDIISYLLSLRDRK